VNALNPQALDTVMEAANGDNQPDEQNARETFASLFDSGAFAFGRAAGSFSIDSGTMAFATVSLVAEDATVLAEGAFDLNTMMMASDWTVRIGAEESDAAEPYVRLFFSGPIANPERQSDLAPLLEALRSRFLERQLDLLDALEREQAAAATVEGVTVDGAPLGSIAPAAPHAGTLGGVPVQDSPTEGSTPLAKTEPAEPATEGGAPEATNAASEAEVATEPEAAPLELLPTEDKPSPPRRERPRRRSAAAPAPAPVPPSPPAPEAAESYRTLPNGVVVKIR
jgi:hypothetical protein